MKIKCKLDTGANANILTLRSFKQIYSNKVTKNNKIVNASFVQQSNTKLIGYSGEPIRHSGSVVFEHDSKSEGITRHLEQRQAVQKGYFDRQAHDLPPLLENQQVSVQDTGTGLWSPVTIVKHSGEPRSYIIETPDGTTLRRNRLHLKDSTRARAADHPPQPDDDDAGDNAATDGESVRQHPSCAPDDPATRSPGLPPGSSNPPGKMTDCASKPTTGLHTRSGRAIKPLRRFTNE
ncbi:transposon Ty3-I Gag-Pol polyprotein [Elysia marginata]|uniref:Transposon Ty3-I Gag-Pol polyprotein n=1 Tax=Elysia marginata TaxID=1093978 RepID=A0AAV4IN89_9GAST|nr:transposon Ty3-I Gag-Pol polyprotein [Elysia marginata]